MAEPGLQLQLYSQEYSVIQIADVSALATILKDKQDFINIAVTRDEVSCVIVKQQTAMLDILHAQDGWRLFKVDIFGTSLFVCTCPYTFNDKQIVGTLDFALVGIIAKIGSILAEESISIFVVR